jgi:hypothetical protein
MTAAAAAGAELRVYAVERYLAMAGADRHLGVGAAAVAL